MIRAAIPALSLVLALGCMAPSEAALDNGSELLDTDSDEGARYLRYVDGMHHTYSVRGLDGDQWYFERDIAVMPRGVAIVTGRNYGTGVIATFERTISPTKIVTDRLKVVSDDGTNATLLDRDYLEPWLEFDEERFVPGFIMEHSARLDDTAPGQDPATQTTQLHETIEVLEPQDVDVPAGSFVALPVHRVGSEVTGTQRFDYEETTYYVRGLGIVKVESDDATHELIEYGIE